MTESQTFGPATRYYSRGQAESEPRLAESAAAADRILRALLGDADTIYRSVERVCRRRNQAIREMLRKEMALGLKPEAQDAIVVRVRHGLPDPFARLVARNPTIQWELAARAELLSNTEAGLKLLLGRFESTSEVQFKGNPPASRADLERSRSLVEAVLRNVEETKMREELKAIEEDVLGAYFFRRREVEIYWLVIGLMAGLLRVSVESLATVVLTHELAHAFTHAGQDTDGRQWETESFASAPSVVIEGLAQFYTEAVCSKLAENEAEPLTAFQHLLGCQSAAYTSFPDWTRGHRNPRETIRASLVGARAQGVKTFQEFSGLLGMNRR